MRGALVFSGSLIVLATLVYLRQAAKARERRGQGFRDFAESLAEYKVPEQILAVIYDRVQRGLLVKIPVRATDKLGDVYGIESEDLDDDIPNIAAKCGRIAQPSQTKVETVRDLVLLIAGYPEQRMGTSAQ